MNTPGIVDTTQRHSGSNEATNETVRLAMQLVEDAMRQVVNSDVKVLHDASNHILDAGGKRIRPRLVVLSFLASGGKDVKSVVGPAAALELVHTASVVHDDINDHGVMRRGRPSINTIWGRTFALLTGDFLFTKVYELMAPYGDLNMLFSEATTALVEGETLQAVAVKEGNFSTEIYMNIIARKTAALFEIGAAIGAKLAGAPPEQVQTLRQFGYNTGLAFQIIDDILDITGSEEELGKSAGLDLKQGKGIASVSNGESGAPQSQDSMDNIKQKLLTGDRLERAKLQARELVETAIDLLTVVPDSPYRSEMVTLAHSIVLRTS